MITPDFLHNWINYKAEHNFKFTTFSEFLTHMVAFGQATYYKNV